jgi:uncharacterized Zn finger protein
MRRRQRRRYDFYDHFQPSKPIETDQGIKAKSQRGDFAKNWWATRWIDAMERLGEGGRLSRGRTYARKGQVLSLEEVKGKIKAKVQGSRPTPYIVTIAITPFSDEEWARVVEALASQALFMAQLLAGEMPQTIEEAFKAAGVSLFPGKRGELKTDCNCPDPANPCKHIAATHYILGEQFDEDPFLIFRLRGRSQEQILAALRAQHGTLDDEEDEETDEETDEVPTLAANLDHFWDTGPALGQLRLAIKPPLTAYPILKRLGQPSFLDEDITVLLGPAYETVTSAALMIAFADQGGGETNGDKK